MNRCSKCILKAKCGQLCAERENEIIKEYVKNGFIEIDVKHFPNKTRMKIVDSIRICTPGSKAFYHKMEEDKLVIEDFSQEGKLKQKKFMEGENNVYNIYVRQWQKD